MQMKFKKNNDNIWYIIRNIEDVKERVESLSKSNVDIEKMKNFMENESNNMFYFDKNLNEKEVNDENTKFVWVDTGYFDDDLNPIFISLSKFENEFRGDFVGTAPYIKNKLIKHYGNQSLYESNFKKNVQKYGEKILKKGIRFNLIVESDSSIDIPINNSEELYTEIGKQLLGMGYKISPDAKFEKLENQIVNETSRQISPVAEYIYKNLSYPNWKSVEGVDRYIKVSGRRIQDLIEQGKMEYFLKNNIGCVVINTGLLDRFGTDYYVLYKYYEKHKTYIADTIISSKADYMNNGFSKEDANMAINLKPIQFVDSPIYFEATMDDFDLNQKCLMHIIKERRDRFPESIQDKTDNDIFTKIKWSLERGLKIQMRDHSYAKLTYSGKDGQVSWMLPLHIENDFTKEPEMVMLIRKGTDFYEIKTVLPYDDAMRDRITAMHLYNQLW